MSLCETHLRYDAKLWFFSKKPQEFETVGDIFTGLQTRYGATKNEQALQKESRHCEQRLGESVSDFEKQLRDIGQKFNPSISSLELLGLSELGLCYIHPQEAVHKARALDETLLMAKQAEQYVQDKEQERRRDKQQLGSNTETKESLSRKSNTRKQ